jgi:hypothetical protein
MRANSAAAAAVAAASAAAAADTSIALIAAVQRVSRKLVHITGGLLFMLVWPLYRSVPGLAVHRQQNASAYA